jgi:Fic family protein
MLGGNSTMNNKNFIDLSPEDFVNFRSGKLVKDSNSITNIFLPNKLPFEINYTPKLIAKISSTERSIGELRGIARHIKPSLLMSAYLKKEAVLSSKIEGTRTSLSEVMIHEKDQKKTRDDDLKEVLNYMKTLNYGIEQIKDKELSIDFIKEMHIMLMSGTRGDNKEPGQFKIKQNWIGESYDISEAKFVPAPPNQVLDLIENLVEYSKQDSELPSLIQIALTHYQFETIHPFRDGNGRIGRLINMLLIIKLGLLDKPLLYLSAFFEKYKQDYTKKLYEASVKDNIEEWVVFFLTAVEFQSKDAVFRAQKLEKYRDECRHKIADKSKSMNALKIIDYLFESPFITIPELKKVLDTKSYSLAKYAAKIVMDQDILLPLETDKKKGQIYVAQKIIDILNEEFDLDEL